MTVTATWYLEVNSVPLDTYAWRVVGSGYDELLNSPAIRGDDLVMPGAQGVRAYPRIIDRTLVSIPMLIMGGLDEDGDPIDDPIEGMISHRDYLRDNLGIADDADPDRGTVQAVFYRGGSLADLAGDVTVLGLFGFTSIGVGEAMVRLDLSIPYGELVEVAS